MFSPSTGTTSMFKTERSFCMSKLDAMEKVAIRLASFATNVSQGASSIPSRLPTSRELYTAARSENARQLDFIPEKEALAFKILCLASDAEGLFFFVNSQSQQEQQSQQHEQPDQGAGATTTNSSPKTFRVHFDEETSAEMTIDKVSNYKSSAFWNVSDSERELFSRLATIEALKAIDEIDKQEKKTCLYSRWLITFFRLGSSAGACAIWFNGSWPGKSVFVLDLYSILDFLVSVTNLLLLYLISDMLIAGFLAVFVAHFQTSNILTKQERIVFEIVASFVVGLTAGILALNWPNHFCFGAMALSGVLDILQGFRVVYSIIEIMSKHTVAGGADLLEGMLFTGLISYFLKFGQYTAARLMGDPKSTTFAECKNGINQWWYLLFLPLAAFSWSALFNPNYVDLPLMGLHGILAYAVNWGLAQVGVDEHLNNFVASLSVSLFAGIVSRFTGRQAVGNTVAGLYVLLPGAYLVRSLYSSDLDATFFIDIIQNSVIIGIGAWTGTIVCSPTLLGTTKGLLAQQSRHNDRGREQSRGTNDTTMLFF